MEVIQMSNKIMQSSGYYELVLIESIKMSHFSIRQLFSNQRIVNFCENNKFSPEIYD